jgi:RHS repeat-associated protein
MAGICSEAFGAIQNAYQYQGVYAEYDDETGWNDFELRSYDPQIGRWIQIDPYDEFPSPYTGMGNDPINLTDPSGGWVFSAVPLIEHGAWAIGGTVIGTVIGGATSGWDGNAMKQGASIGFGAGLGASFVNWGAVGGALADAGKWVGNNIGGLLQGVNLHLYYEGEAFTTNGYKDDGGKVPNNQIGRGNLHVQNDKDEDVEDPYSAVSGPDGNGLLPNGEYEVTIKLKYTKNGPEGYTDDKGASFKLYLKPKKIEGLNDVKKFKRTELLIHPTTGGKSGNNKDGTNTNKDGTTNYNSRTHGCIGINGGHSETERFWTSVSNYLQNNGGKMMLKVDIKGNLNVSWQK